MIRRLTTTAVKRGLLRWHSIENDASKSIDDIVKRCNDGGGQNVLSKADVDIILRRKQKKDRMVVQKIDKGEEEPDITIDQIRKLGETTKQVAQSEVIEQKIAHSETKTSFNDIMAYSSKLEMYLRGIEPVPSEIRTFKYGLPIPNIDPEFKGIQEISDIISPVANTPNENLWMQLAEVDGDTSYEDFERAIRTRFNFEMDMYGQTEDIAKHQDMMVDGSDSRLKLLAKNSYPWRN